MFEIEDFKNTPVRICKIEKSYINYMRKFDKRVPIKSGRKYICLVVLINNIHYVVPLTSKGADDRELKGKNKRSPIVTTNLKNIADVLHNNMFPIPEMEIKDIKDISAYTDSYLNYEYRFIRKKWSQINIKSINTYRNRYDKNHKDYKFLKLICCDFKKLEEECLGWSYNHLTIKLKEEYSSKEYIEIKNEEDIATLVQISHYGVYSRCEGFDETSSELQNITVYAKDEFGQEKSVSFMVKAISSEELLNNFEKVKSEISSVY